MDDRYYGLKYQYGYFSAQLNDTKSGGTWNAIIHVDLKSKIRRVFSVLDEDVVSEAIFVPKDQGIEGEGYLLTLIYRSRLNRSDLVILDSTKIDNGPISIIEIPHRIPFGFHGCWKPRSE